MVNQGVAQQWGASGAGYELSLILAEGMMVTATYEGLRWIAHRMADKVKARYAGDERPELDDEAAVRTAEYAVHMRLAKGPDQERPSLELRSIRRESDHVVVELRHEAQETEYEVVVEQVGGIIALGRVRTTRIVS